MRIVFGLFLIIVSFLGTTFFRKYSGTIIPYPFLWYTGFIVVGLIGSWLIYSSFKRASSIIKNEHNSRIKKLKETAEKIELNFDHCEFKKASYSHEVEDENVNSLKWIAPTTMPDLTTKVTETVVRSYLIYKHSLGETTEKFVSQAFPFDEKTLGFYVLNHNITLYVDRFDRNKYFFDLKR